MTALLPVGVLVLVASTLGEFLLLRVFIRMGREVPDSPLAGKIFAAMFHGGMFSLNLAGVLAAASTLLIAGLLFRLRSRRATLASAVLVSSLFVAAATWLLSVSDRPAGTTVLALQVYGVALTILVLAVIAPWGGWARAWIVLIGLSYVLIAAGYGTRLSDSSPLTSAITVAGETAAVLSAILAPLALRPRWSRSAAIMAALPSAAFLGFAFAHPDVARFLVIWDFGFTGAVAPGVMAISLFSVCYAGVASLLSRETRMLGAGLLLVALGGVRLEYTYYGLLALAGTALLFTSPWVGSSAAISSAKRSGLPGFRLGRRELRA